MARADGLTVLVVDDDEYQRQFAGRMLLSLGASQTLEAADGRQALLRIASGSRVDLILCDLDMPGMDGMEFIRHLGQANSRVSVVVASAHHGSLLNSVEKMAKAYGIQLLGLIKKPISRSQLEILLERHGQSGDARARSAVPSFSIDEILAGIREREFEAFFQPKVDLSSGRTIGAEALARWRHPQHGLIGPGTFIATLEECERIDELSELMLERAATACRAWREHGRNLTVSVNLSLVSLIDTGLADRITDIVRATGLDPRLMVLEITETVAMTEVAPALENLARLRMRGFGLSIDDYGTGFSSLRRLTRIPYTELKIDQGFVTGLASNASSRAIVESSVGMARRLDLNSVAEGVETKAEWDLLKSMGCNMAQGYFIAKPMPEESFLAHLARQDAN